MTRQEIPPAEPVALAGLADYVPGSVVSRIIQKSAVGMLTLFAFDSGEGVSEHTTPCDAFALILDGSADLTVGGKRLTAAAGQIVLMPAGVPHSLQAKERFKMLLVMLRG